MDYELLQLKTIFEVRSLVTQKGLRWAKTDKKAKLIKSLMEMPDDPVEPKERPKEEEEKEVVVPATQAEVLEVLKDNLALGLQVKFDDGCWHIRAGNGREDSGNLTVPLRIIKRSADGLMRRG